MSGRMVRIAPVALAIIAVQGLAVLLYLGIERHRDAARHEPFRFERLRPGRAAPDLVLARPEGATVRLAELRGKSVLLHFWATWCPPCREELPGLLALGRELSRGGELEVLAVTLDQDWATVRKFFDGDIPAEVVQDASKRSAGVYDVSALPDTYLVGPDGTLRLRFGGPRDWHDEAAREVLQRYREKR